NYADCDPGDVIPRPSPRPWDSPLAQTTRHNPDVLSFVGIHSPRKDRTSAQTTRFEACGGRVPCGRLIRPSLGLVRRYPRETGLRRLDRARAPAAVGRPRTLAPTARPGSLPAA